MDINYIYYGATEVAIPSTTQITMSWCTFTDNKADGDGGFMSINANAILMSISYTTFNTLSAGGKGGVFLISNLGSLTLSYVTATYFYAPSGGRFIH